MELTHVSSLLSLARFEDSTRLFTLRIADQSEALMVVALHGHESLSELSELTIDLVATNALLDIDSWPGRQASLGLRLADGSQAERSGYIREALALDSDGGLAAYRLIIVPGLWLTTRQQRNRVFQERSVLQIVEEVLAPYAPRIQFRYAEGLDRFVDSARPRSYCVQYRETDHDFLARLLAEEGIGYRLVEVRGADAEGDAGSAPADTLGIEPGSLIEFFADSTTLPQDPSAASILGGSGLRFHAAGSLEARDGIQALAGLRQLQPATTTVASYDYKRKQVVSAEVPTAHAFGGAHAPSLEAYDWAGVYAWGDGDEASRYATLMREAIEARNKCWQGLATVRTLRPGRWFELTGSPLDSQGGAPESRQFLVTRTVFCGRNNQPPDLSERVTRLGLGTAMTGSAAIEATAPTPEDWARARKHGYHTRFEALRRAIPWRPILADGTGARPNPRNVSNPRPHPNSLPTRSEETPSHPQSAMVGAFNSSSATTSSPCA